MADGVEPPTVFEYVIRSCGAVVVLAATIVLSIVETFLVPVRAAHMYLPVAALLAAASNIAFPLAMLYLTRVRGLALLPGLAWFVIVIAATTPTGEGDLVIPAIWPGVVMLVVGAGTFATMGYLLLAGSLGRRESINP